MKAADATVLPLVTAGPRDFARHAGGLVDDFGGVITRVDVVRGEGGVRSPSVHQVMAPPVLVATRDTPATTLFDAMTRYEVLPVLDDGQVIGPVTRLSLLQLIDKNHQKPHGEAGRAVVHS